MSERIIARALAPLARRIANMAVRGVVRMVNATAKMQGLQVSLLASEVKDRLEHCETYGFTAHPHGGAEAVVLFIGGDRSHGLVIATPDRRYRLRGLETGEVAIYDDRGHVIKLGRDGIVIDGGGHNLTIINTTKVRVESPRLECTGDIVGNVP